MVQILSRHHNNMYTIQEILNDVYDSSSNGLRIAGTVDGDLTVTGDFTVEGNFNFGDAGTDILTVAGYIQGTATGKTFVAIGDASTSHLFSDTDDLVIGGKLEVNNDAYFDNNMTLSGFRTFNMGSGIFTYAGTGTNTFGISGTYDYIIIAPSIYRTKNFDHSVYADPAMIWHSETNPDTDNTQWGSIRHDKTNFVLDVGSGGIEMFGDESYGGGWVTKSATVQTTDATVTDIATIAVGEDESFMVKVYIQAYQDDGASYNWYELSSGFYRDAGGNVTQQGGAGGVVVASSEGEAALDATINADTANQTIDIRVTGKAAENFNWKVIYKYIKLTA